MSDEIRPVNLTRTRLLYPSAPGLWQAQRWAQTAFAPPPTADVPVITFDGSNLAGATYVRPKRVGDVAGAALDLAGDTRFRYLGFPGAVGVGADPNNYVRSELKPGGSAQAAYWPFSFEFETTADIVQIVMRASATNEPMGIVLVNGRWVQETAIATTVSAGQVVRMRLTFPATGFRRITVIGMGPYGGGGLGGVLVTNGHSIIRPTYAVRRRIAVIGDSFTNGSGSAPTGALNTETFALPLAYLLGADEAILAGIGSTGWTAMSNNDPASTFGGRVSTVLSMNPDTIIFAGSRNDAANAAAIQAAVESALRACARVPQVYVTGPLTTSHSAQNAAVKAGARAAGRPFIDMCGLIYGTGKDGSPTGNGNADFFLRASDGVHPTYAGHRYYLAALYAGLCSAYSYS